MSIKVDVIMTGTESVEKSHSNIFEKIDTMQKEQVIKEKPVDFMDVDFIVCERTPNVLW